MEKNTVIAIILVAIIIAAGSLITRKLNEGYIPPVVEGADDSQVPEVPIPEKTESFTRAPAESKEIPPGDQDYEKKRITEETDLFRIIFNTVGAAAEQIELTAELDKGRPIPMVLGGDEPAGTFNIAFGGTDAPYITDVFSHRRTRRGRQIIHDFSRDYMKDGQVFTLTKSYRVIPGEYVIELIVSLQTPDGRAVPLLDADEAAYTLTYGPQIGPLFKKIDGRYEIRDNVSWGPDPKRGKLKRAVHKGGREKFARIDHTVNWAGILGKYFGVIADPGSGSSVISWDNRPADGQEEASRLQISRPARRQSIIEDTYRFYIGPLSKPELIRYDSAEGNAFGISGMGLGNAPRTRALLGWLESILRFLLEQFHRLIANWGVAIILLTILIKAVLYPFTHKSYESTSRMQAIQPKVKALQEQYKGEPQKLQAKTAELYKAEGVNPLGGCLPMLFQIPIMIGLFNVLNQYFPLRGAPFIPGWITDLSAPEYIWREFERPINLLFIEIPAVRILPVIYLGGQLLMTKVTQQGSAGAQSGGQQKMLTIGMPIMFFFILYNMPSGLLLYWSVMNIITIGQQLVTNYLKKRKAAGGNA